MRYGALAVPLSIGMAFCVTADEEAPAPQLRHSHTWVRERLRAMLAVDDAYLWHDVLGGRAIHQNSSTNPPTEPLEGNFHTQQQGFFALMKLRIYELPGFRDAQLLDDAQTLLDWVLANGYDAELHTFYFRYNRRDKQWVKTFYPEFNMITVAALLRYNAVRPAPRYVEVANDVFQTITRVAWDAEHGGFMSGFTWDADKGTWTCAGDKGLYGAGYLAVMMLDAYDATGESRFLEWARKAVDACNEHLWDAEHGAWFPSAGRHWRRRVGSTKLTHIIADMIQANYLLYVNDRGEDYLEYAEKAMAFLVEHSRTRNGLWYRHTTRDGSDPTAGPDLDADGGPGTALPYDRQMQVIVACCLAWRATHKAQYLRYVDDTLDAMEQTHRIDYPVGVNYGYMGRDNAQNTWCHLWGLKGFATVVRLQADFK